MADRMAMLIDYEYCVGCSECEIACMESHCYDPDQIGIKVQKLGPWRSPAGGWQYDFVPFPTDWCDICEGRVVNGERTACQEACTYGVIKIGEVYKVGEIAEIKGRQLMIVR